MRSTFRWLSCMASTRTQRCFLIAAAGTGQPLCQPFCFRHVLTTAFGNFFCLYDNLLQ